MVDRSKQGIIERGELVLKRHNSIKSANLEMQVARNYANQQVSPISIPIYREPFVENSLVYLPYKKIKGKSLMGNSDLEITIKLVRDLALFHEIFAQKPGSASVIYRDAINSNYLLDKEEIVHIDFSSSNQFIHSFDDLALCIHPLWGKSTKCEREKLIKEYLEFRKNLNGSDISKIEKISLDQISQQSPDERKENYKDLITNMESSGMYVGNLKNKIDKVDFVNLNMADYDTFFKFRTIRGEFYLQKVWRNK